MIISIVGGDDLGLMEVDAAASHIRALVDPDANIIWGSALNNALEGKVRISVVATGIEAEQNVGAEPARVFAFPGFKGRVDAPAAQPSEPEAPETVAEAKEATADEDELLLDDTAMLDDEPLPVGDSDLTGEAGTTEPTSGSRWLTPEPENPTKVVGGSLFERMSNLARSIGR